MPVLTTVALADTQVDAKLGELSQTVSRSEFFEKQELADRRDEDNSDVSLNSELAQPPVADLLPVSVPKTSVQPLSQTAASPTLSSSESNTVTPTVGPDLAPVSSDALELASPVNPTSSENPLLSQVADYRSPNRNPNRNPNGPSDSLAQLTSVTQLSDVQPTDWAYQALQSLVERYGCIVGYPDRTFRGQQALSRFEFAAGVNACLDRIGELLAASTADLATQEDLAILQRLQEEFAAELAALRGRVDVLDARTAELEANQFSTTTKLSGDAYFTVSDLFGEDVESDNNTVFQYRSRLIFTTSFSGEDQLGAIFQAGNVQRFIQPGNEIRLAGEASTGGNIVLDTLNYVFPVGDQALVAVFANAAGLDSLGFGVITPFDIAAVRGAVSRFGQRPPIYRVANVSTGAAVNLFLTDEISLQVGYAGGEAGSPEPGNGLFNGNYGLIGQLKARNLFDVLDLSLTYVNSYTGISTTASGAINAGVQTGTGSLLAAVDADRPVVANSYGAAANLKFDGFQIGGWAGFSAIRALELGDADVWNYGLTLAFPDLGGRGNLGGIVVGIQPRLTGSTPNLGTVLGRRRDPDTGLHVEAFYRIALNDNIDITPAVVWLTAPNHNNDNADIFFGAVRTTFRF
ncbi:MAG: carbohydrate porin [Elainella sp. C42_A2020_010]|nr:carbohydrate porin [Elainella sp. C42_A2020_010]